MIKHLRSFLPWCSTLVGVLLLCATTGRAESDLERIIRQQNEQNVKGYIQPIADLFGANMHSGFSHNANIPSSGFHFRLDIIAMGALVSEEQETYSAADPWGGTFKTATVFGDSGKTTSPPGDASLQYRGSDGILNTTIFPFASPQVTLGHVYGTEAVIRYVPIPEMGDGKIPKITLFGIGVRHSLSQYLKDSPLDIAAGFMYNSFTLGDLITVKGYALALQASKQFSVLVLYGGVQYEKSTLTLSYNSSASSSPVNVDLEGSNVIRGTIGAGFDLAILKIFADANFGAVTSFSAGIGFGF